MTVFVLVVLAMMLVVAVAGAGIPVALAVVLGRSRPAFRPFALVGVGVLGLATSSVGLRLAVIGGSAGAVVLSVADVGIALALVALALGPTLCVLRLREVPR